MKKTNPIVFTSIALFGALLLLIDAGCASVVRGSSEKFIVQSTPSGAEVRLSTGQAGVTPFEVEVKRKDTLVVTVSKPGYKEFTTSVISSIDGASLGLGSVANFVTLPIINDVVDYKTGANFSHKPNPLIVTLFPAGSTESSAAATAPVPPPAVTPAPAPAAAPASSAPAAAPANTTTPPVAAPAPAAPASAGAPATPAAAPKP